MNEKFSISIDKPCTEKFSDFVSTDKGGYCSSCQKTVIDFTKMSDQEIIHYFDTSKKNTCGFFLESQLKTYSKVNPVINQQKSNKFISSVFGFSLFSILSFSTGYSQEKSKGNETVKIEKDTAAQNSDSLDVNSQHRIKGIVSDASGPLPGANIYLKGKNIGTQSDFDGAFTFPKKLSVGDILIVSFMGCTDQEIKITNDNINVRMYDDIRLKEDFVVMTGEVSTNRVYKSKRTFVQKLKSLFAND